MSIEAVGWDCESESKSELQSKAKAESEPEWKRRRWEESKEVSSFCFSEINLESDPEWEEWYRSGLGPDSPEDESEEESRTPPWKLKASCDLELSDLAMYDNDPLPIACRTKNGLYMNQAMIDEEKAWDEYVEQASKLPPPSPWDPVPPPHNLSLVGGIRSYTITDEDRPRFIHYCHLSLHKYNAENQGANFVFYQLVKATSPVSCPRYYITFMAKDASNNNTNVSTFQAEVSDKLVPNPLEAKVILCKRKPN